MAEVQAFITDGHCDVVAADPLARVLEALMFDEPTYRARGDNGQLPSTTATMASLLVRAVSHVWRDPPGAHKWT